MAITKIGESQDFSYTGGIQTFSAPFNGIYMLEVYGAQGGYTTLAGGKGGYSKGYVALSKNDILYICVGGKGGNTGSGTSGAGYNGGGYGTAQTDSKWNAGGGGGGATHIAKTAGVLSSLSNNKSDVIIVAGGGGGAGCNRADDAYYNYGGTGGGTNGGYGILSAQPTWTGRGGTQTSGGLAGYNGDNGNGSFGQGGSCNCGGAYGSGGGGGYYGGGAGGNGNGTCSAGGGSGYIGGVNDGTTANGQREGNGYAKITFIEKTTHFGYIGDKEIVGIALGDNTISGWKVG